MIGETDQAKAWLRRLRRGDSRALAELFDHLDAPVRRLGSLDCHVGYAPQLEKAVLPQAEDVLAVALELARY